VIGDNDKLYENFNSQFEGKLLALVEEARGKDDHINNNILKSRITSKTNNINKKFASQYKGNFTNKVKIPKRDLLTGNNRRTFQIYFVTLSMELDSNNLSMRIRILITNDENIRN